MRTSSHRPSHPSPALPAAHPPTSVRRVDASTSGTALLHSPGPSRCDPRAVNRGVCVEPAARSHVLRARATLPCEFARRDACVRRQLTWHDTAAAADVALGHARWTRGSRSCGHTARQRIAPAPARIFECRRRPRKRAVRHPWPAAPPAAAGADAVAAAVIIGSGRGRGERL